MTSDGLESIALAVAHLERVNEGQTTAHRQKPVEAGPSPSLSEVPPVPPPAPLGTSVVTSARIVSAEVCPEQHSASATGASETASLATATSTCFYPHRPSHDATSNNNDSLTSTHTGAPATWVVQPTTTNQPTGEAAFSNGAPPPASWDAPAVVRYSAQEESPSHFNKTTQAQAEPLRSKNSIAEMRYRNHGNPGNLKNLQPYFAPADFATADCPPVPLPSESLEVGPDDVIFGRGGSSNHHSGNIQYRQLVKACQHAYLAAKRRDKPRIAAGIVLAVRKVGGRFLKKDVDNVAWRDVGNNRAREKTSQALREGAPELRDVATSKTTRPSDSTAISQPRSTHNAPGHGLPKKSFSKILPKSRGRPKKTENKGTKRGAPVLAHNVMNSTPGWGKLVENYDAMIPHPPDSKKQRRPSALENLAVAATLRPVPETRRSSVIVPAAAPFVVSGGAAVIATPKCVPTVSSGDDDDGSSSSFDHRETDSKTASQNRGPRIKLLKQRLLTNNE